MAPVIGGCAVLSFGGLVGRLVGARLGAGRGARARGAACPSMYVSRAPFAEPLVQVLLFGGLCLFTDSFAVRSRLRRAGRGMARGSWPGLAAWRSG